MFQESEYKSTEDGACIFSCSVKNETCTNHTTVFIYDSIKLINLIKPTKEKQRSEQRGEG